MKILLVYHKNPYSKNPRGGELSVRAIIEYLSSKGHHIAMSDGPGRDMVIRADIVLTWGRPAEQTARVCKRLGVPLVLMVRFWKNIADTKGGVGNLMEQEVDTNFTKSKEHLFETAAAIITNTDYARQVIERWQPVSKGKVHVSYVPILGQYEPIEKPGDKITVITPEIYGENWLVNGLAKLMPEEKFLVVNGQNEYFKAEHQNIEVRGYMEPEEIWKETKMLLQPVYGNDICGTRRTTIECVRHGLPVLASNRCGMREKLLASMIVTTDADIDDWKHCVSMIQDDYKYFQDLAKSDWEQYDTPAQLAQFEQIMLNCVG